MTEIEARVKATEVWNKLEAFSGYGFNRSHSAAYGVMSYWSQWFKVNYPLEFWTTSLQFATDGEMVYRISEFQKLKTGIELKPPDINKSGYNFTCDDNNIYWSLVKIKNIGDNTSKYIIEERKNGEYKSYIDFVTRIPKKFVNKRAVNCLILAGAFDMLEGIKQPYKRLDLLKLHAVRNSDEVDEKYNTTRRYFWIFEQKDLTGYGEVDYKSMLKRVGLKKLAVLYKVPYDFFNNSKDYEDCVVCGILNFSRVRKTRKGNDYATLEVVCNNDVIIVMLWEVPMFHGTPDKYGKGEQAEHTEENFDLLAKVKGKVICINGKVKYDSWRDTKVLHSQKDTKIRIL